MLKLLDAMKYYILLIAVVTFLRTPLFKGWFGELVVKIHLKRLDSEKYKVLNDITVQLEGKNRKKSNLLIKVTQDN